MIGTFCVEAMLYRGFTIVFERGGVEILLNNPSPPRWAIASASKKLIADQSGILHFFNWKIELADRRAHVSHR